MQVQGGDFVMRVAAKHVIAAQASRMNCNSHAPMGG
jgi:hypothetical protein